MVNSIPMLFIARLARLNQHRGGDDALQVLAVAGNGEPGDADGPANEAQFSFPIGIAVGRDGTIYVADSGNHKVRKITPGGVVVTVAGTGQAGFNDGAAAEAQFANNKVQTPQTQDEPEASGLCYWRI